MTDNIGALSAMTPESTRAALGLAQRGQVFDLGVHLGNATPHLPPDAVLPFLLTQFRTPGHFAQDAAMRGVSFSVELIQGSVHQSSHMDALIHAQRHGRVFGNRPVAELLTDNGWRSNGIESVPPILSRAVVIDVAAVVGQTPVPDGYAVSAEQLQVAVQQQAVTVRPGDTVLIRTGKIVQFATDRLAFEAGCPGISGPAARWLAEQGMMMFGLDATSADPQPTPDWDDTVRECLFICLPLKIEGATGSWVRPVALARDGGHQGRRYWDRLGNMTDDTQRIARTD